MFCKRASLSDGTMKDRGESTRLNQLGSDRQAIIMMRNEKTGRGIRRKYKKMTSDQLPLPFFAVSSVHYNAQAVGFMADDEFPLPVDATGIPALRRYCYQFPAKGLLDALTHYREGILAELVSSLFMWSSQYKVQRRSALRTVVARPRQVGRQPADLCFSWTDEGFTGDRSYRRQLCPRNQFVGRQLHFGEVECVAMMSHFLLRYTDRFFRKTLQSLD